MRVLVVEDEPDAARMIPKDLREQSYAVDVVGDGSSAALQAATSDYDAIVLDVLLPGQDGIQVYRQEGEQGTQPHLRCQSAAVPSLSLIPASACAPRWRDI